MRACVVVQVVSTRHSIVFFFFFWFFGFFFVFFSCCWWLPGVSRENQFSTDAGNVRVRAPLLAPPREVSAAPPHGRERERERERDSVLFTHFHFTLLFLYMMKPHDTADEEVGVQMQVTDSSPHNTRAAALVAVAEAAAAAAAAAQQQEELEQHELRKVQLKRDQADRRERQEAKEREDKARSAGAGQRLHNHQQQLRRVLSQDAVTVSLHDDGAPADLSSPDDSTSRISQASDGMRVSKSSPVPRPPPPATVGAATQMDSISAWVSGTKTSNLVLAFIAMVAVVLIILQFQLQMHHDIRQGHLPPQPGVAHKLHKKLVEAPHIKHAANAVPHAGNEDKFSNLPSAKTTTRPSAEKVQHGRAGRDSAHHGVHAFGDVRPLDVYGADITPVGKAGVMERIVVGQTINGMLQRRTVFVHMASNSSMVPNAVPLPVLLGFHDRGDSAAMLMQHLQAVVDPTSDTRSRRRDFFAHQTSLANTADHQLVGVYIEARPTAENPQITDWVTKPPTANYARGNTESDDDDTSDDELFVLRVLATLRDLKSRHIRGTAVNGLDFSRMSAFGAGTGGQLALRLAKDTSKLGFRSTETMAENRLFTRVVVQGTSLPESFGHPEMQTDVAIPTLLLHGEQDTEFPYGGNRAVKSPAQNRLSVEDTALFAASQRAKKCEAGGMTRKSLSSQVVQKVFACPGATAQVLLFADGEHELNDDIDIEGVGLVSDIVARFVLNEDASPSDHSLDRVVGAGEAVASATMGRRRIRDLGADDDSA